jgi:23S rRNA pseudouridine2605 synthase
MVLNRIMGKLHPFLPQGQSFIMKKSDSKPFANNKKSTSGPSKNEASKPVPEKSFKNSDTRTESLSRGPSRVRGTSKADSEARPNRSGSFDKKTSFNKENISTSRGRKPFSDSPRSQEKSFEKRGEPRAYRPYNAEEGKSTRDRKPYADSPRSFGRSSEKQESSRTYKGYKSDDEKSPKPRFTKDKYENRGERTFGERKDRPFKSGNDFISKKGRFDKTESSDKRPRKSTMSPKPKRAYDEDHGTEFKVRKPWLSDENASEERPSRTFDKKENTFERPARRFSDREEKKPKFTERSSERYSNRGSRFEEPIEEPISMSPSGKREFSKQVGLKKQPEITESGMRAKLPEKVKAKLEKSSANRTEDIRLNRFIANAGLCSRREADEFIASGQITVNGKVITEMGYKVLSTDTVKYGRKILNRQKLTYVLLNKPKDFLTTTEDPEGRRTVMELVKNATNERVYPVGRLDRATTGLLLFTNDGELADKLSHPSNEIKKIYQLEIDKKISQEHFDQILAGVELEDGIIKADDLSIISPDGMVLGIEIHSGKNRIVRRIFESLGYEVLKLDRSSYAGITKKDLPRGNWRYLTEKEVIRLKYLI